MGADRQQNLANYNQQGRDPCKTKIQFDKSGKNNGQTKTLLSRKI